MFCGFGLAEFVANRDRNKLVIRTLERIQARKRLGRFDVSPNRCCPARSSAAPTVIEGVRRPGADRLVRPAQQGFRQRMLAEELCVPLAVAVDQCRSPAHVGVPAAAVTASATGRSASRAASPVTPRSSASGSTRTRRNRRRPPGQLGGRSRRTGYRTGRRFRHTHGCFLAQRYRISRPCGVQRVKPGLRTRRPGSTSRSSSRLAHRDPPPGPARSASTASRGQSGSGSSAGDMWPLQMEQQLDSRR